MDWIAIADWAAKWLPVLITSCVGAYVAFKNIKRDDKKSLIESAAVREDYWEKVSNDLRGQIAAVRKDTEQDRANNLAWRLQATKAFDYLCIRVKSVDIAGVEIARQMWAGVIVVVEPPAVEVKG